MSNRIRRNITIIGLGYVGCVTAACLARDGHRVIGVDVDAEKVDRVGRGLAPLEEPGLGELMGEAVRAGRLSATTRLAEAVAATDAAMICVGTPTGPDGRPDLRQLAEVAQDLGTALRPASTSFTVLVRSTVPPGTAEGLIAEALRRASRRPIASHGILVLTLPEFLREAEAIADYDDPPFVVVGGPSPAPAHARRLIADLFAAFQDRIHWVSHDTAELLKNVCNAFHATKVVFANEVGALCAAAGVDGVELMRVFCEDRKLNVSPAYLRPGQPFGGSCLPKDLRALLDLGRQRGVAVPQLAATLRSNELHVERVIEIIEEVGCTRIGIDGLAFKSGTDDLRGSPMVTIAERLLGRGLELRIHDPVVWRSPLRASGRMLHVLRHLVETPAEVVDHAELIVCARSKGHVVDEARRLEVPPLVLDLGRSPRRPARAAERSTVRGLEEPRRLRA